ncbi:hypothetical protein [Hyphomonas sp.]|uniref:hypothetical protein n=1 Tax=Hyphomonas sp. TaxID=87 RepID=UPI0025C44C51|nr:hypothetical protein [Hyphomonas sp.]MBI1399468.1 hypothetical protein [Hyphomonas sp.]
MLAGKKQESEAFEAPVQAPGTPPADVAKAVGAEGGGPHASPARALQQRLIREIVQPARSWLWHSAGLVLVAILSLSVAGLMLGSGL